INQLLENNARQPTNDGTSTTRRVLLMPHKATNVASRPSSFVPQNRTPNSQHTLVSQRAVVRNTQPGVLPTSLPISRDQVNPVAARCKRQTPLNDNSDGINRLLENNVPKITNVATSSSGSVSPKATNVARRPSSCVPEKLEILKILLQTNVVCNTPTGVVGNHSLPTGGDQITPVVATRKRKNAVNDSSRGMFLNRDEHGSRTGGTGTGTDGSENRNFKKNRNREPNQIVFLVPVPVPVLVPVPPVLPG
ncbi:hypothetical protein Tco_1076653, partial [Tanacetum coccineum]